MRSVQAPEPRRVRPQVSRMRCWKALSPARKSRLPVRSRRRAVSAKRFSAVTSKKSTSRRSTRTSQDGPANASASAERSRGTVTRSRSPLTTKVQPRRHGCPVRRTRGCRRLGRSRIRSTVVQRGGARVGYASVAITRPAATRSRALPIQAFSGPSAFHRVTTSSLAFGCAARGPAGGATWAVSAL